MNPLVRRRTAVGAVAAVTALLAGLVVAPQVLAQANGVSVSPGLVFNTETAKVLTFTARDTFFQYGGTATFNGLDVASSFTVEVDADDPVAMEERHTGEATVNFTDLNSANNDTASGVGRDGPVDAGTYGVTTVGGDAPDPVSENVIGPGGGTDTCTSCFLVQSPGPVAVTSVAPTSLRPNATANVSVLGNNFERGSAIELLFPGTTTVDTTITTNLPPLNASNAPVYQGITTRTQLQRQFKLTAASQVGPRDVRVRNRDGNAGVCLACFNVAGPSLSSISVPGGTNEPGQALTTITFNGPQVVNPGTPALEFIGVPGGSPRSALTIPGQNTRNNTGTSVTADFDLSNAAPGDSVYQPVVRGDGGFNACDVCRFTVTQSSNRVPTIASMDSDTATAGIQKDIKQGESKDFFVTGTNFSKGAGLSFTPAGLTVTSVDFISPESLLARVTAANPTASGGRDAVVTLTDGKKSNTCTGCVTVAANASPSPSGSSSASPVRHRHLHDLAVSGRLPDQRPDRAGQHQDDQRDRARLGHRQRCRRQPVDRAAGLQPGPLRSAELRQRPDPGGPHRDR